jgi:hypothetical protein
VTYRPVARQRLSKHTPAGANGRNNTTSTARQRISKQAFSTTQWLCFLRGPCGEFIKGQRRSSGRELSRFGSSSGDGSPRSDKEGIRQ